MDGLFSNTTRDIIASIGVTLAVIQTLLSFRYSSATSSADAAGLSSAKLSARQSFSRLVLNPEVKTPWFLFLFCTLLVVIFSLVTGRSSTVSSLHVILQRLQQADSGSGEFAMGLLFFSAWFQGLTLCMWVSASYFELNSATCSKKSWGGFLGALSAVWMLVSACLFWFGGKLPGIQIFALAEMFALGFALVFGLFLVGLGLTLERIFS